MHGVRSSESPWLYFNKAIPLLEQTAASLPGRALKERAFFLLGQLNDFQGYTQNAFTAFNRVSDHYFNYEIQFEAQKKKLFQQMKKLRKY